ncbi:MAG: YcnI family protein [Alphaproteobacteria bacterium]|nr:YcnI family protein [Alphaproteobacteria bacterium]
MNRHATRAAVLGAALAVTLPAAAHVTLERGEAPADSYYKAVFRVPHGCDGSPTLRVRVRIPDGVVGVKVQPKPGWTIETVMRRLDTPYDAGHGRMSSEIVGEVAWSGGRLLDEHYDEFALRAKLPNRPGALIHFPVVQECEKGVHRWIEIPSAGQRAHDLKEPAPALLLAPPAH